MRAGDQTHLKGRLETSFQSIEPLSTAPRDGVANGAAESVCTQGQQAQLLRREPPYTARDERWLRQVNND